MFGGASEQERIRRAIEAMRVVSSTSFAWFGLEHYSMRLALMETCSAESIRAVLVRSISECFYRQFYCAGAAIDYSALSSSRQWLPDSVLLRQLTDANSGQGCLQSGWRVVMASSEKLLVERDGLTVSVTPKEERKECISRIDANFVSLLAPKGAAGISPATTWQWTIQYPKRLSGCSNVLEPRCGGLGAVRQTCHPCSQSRFRSLHTKGSLCRKCGGPM